MNFEPLYKDKLPEGIDSLQEVYFEWWLQELIDLGYLKRFERCTRYTLIDSVFHDKTQKKPIKKDPNRVFLIQKEFLKSWTYEPDYNLYWTEKSYNFLFRNINFLHDKDFETLFYAEWINDEWKSVVDIKPVVFRGGSMSSSVKFPLIQKMMYYKHKIYVHKISPIGEKSLFVNTFTPRRYLYQDKKQVNRKISQWKPISITQFLENKNAF